MMLTSLGINKRKKTVSYYNKTFMLESQEIEIKLEKFVASFIGNIFKLKNS